MRLPDLNRVDVTARLQGLSTAGVTGNVLLVAVLWGQISPWWLILAVLLILSGLGFETRSK
jgi:hypothetical protein